MFFIILFFVGGVLAGFLMRNISILVRGIDRTVEVYIYFFLFLLGVSVGINEVVMKSLWRLGWYAAVIAFSGMVGSALLSYLVYRVFFDED